MVILVEGMPQTGKNTLCRELSQALGTFGWWFTESFTGDIPQRFKTLLDDAKDRLVLLHGSHLQFVARKDRSDLSLLEWSVIDDAFARDGVYLILLQDDPFRIEQRLRQRNALTMTREEIGSRQNYLNKLFETSVIPSKGRYTLRQFVDQDDETTPAFDKLVTVLKEKRCNFQR
jgi:hypothetical protein